MSLIDRALRILGWPPRAAETPDERLERLEDILDAKLKNLERINDALRATVRVAITSHKDLSDLLMQYRTDDVQEFRNLSLSTAADREKIQSIMHDINSEAVIDQLVERLMRKQLPK